MNIIVFVNTLRYVTNVTFIDLSSIQTLATQRNTTIAIRNIINLALRIHVHRFDFGCPVSLTGKKMKIFDFFQTIFYKAELKSEDRRWSWLSVFVGFYLRSLLVNATSPPCSPCQFAMVNGPIYVRTYIRM